MISYTEAKSILLNAVNQYSSQIIRIKTLDSVGYVCARDIVAPIPIQPFDNSAMDGYAVRFSDVKNASENAPVSLPKQGVIAAGDPVPNFEIRQGQCVQIMTGAPVPQGVDTVIPIERVQEIDGGAMFLMPLVKGANIRLAGEDFQKGECVLRGGRVLESQHILPLATLGVYEIEVYRKPTAIFYSTGEELVDDLSKDLQSGQIYNSNKPYACMALQKMGADVVSSKTIPDNLDDFVRELTAAMDADVDIVLSSGSVSAGSFDFVRPALEKIGAEVLYHKVMMKPGKPNLLARLPNGALYFGLPGNPVSTAVGLRFFVQPALTQMSGRFRSEPLMAKLAHDYSKKQGFRLFLKARTFISDEGELSVELSEGQASFQVSPFLKMNSWIVLEENDAQIKKGDDVAIFGLWSDRQLII